MLKSNAWETRKEANMKAGTELKKALSINGTNELSCFFVSRELTDGRQF